MAKILLEVYVPARADTFEVVADSGVVAADFAEIVCEKLSAMEEQDDTVYNSVVLADIDTKKVLAGHLTLEAQNVKSGHRLIVV